jgi:hypothetical protein
MTNGNSAERERFEYARSLLPNEMYWGEPITVAAVLHIADAALSVCADGGKDSSGAEPVEESDVRPKERLCGGSHIACNGVDYCLGHPSCRDIANERAKKEQK